MAATQHLPPARLNDSLVPLCQKSRRVANESLRDKASRLTMPTLSLEAAVGICRALRTDHPVRYTFEGLARGRLPSASWAKRKRSVKPSPVRRGTSRTRIYSSLHYAN